MSSNELTEWIDALNSDYAQIHTAKEDAFWVAYMGLDPDSDRAREKLQDKETQLKEFLSCPKTLARVRQLRAELTTGDSNDEVNAIALQGWERTLAAHVVESDEVRDLAHSILDAESRLHQARTEMTLGYEDPENGFVPASSVNLSVRLGTEKDPAIRRACWNALGSIEDFVLDHGFIDIVRQRNRMGRLLGGDDFYDATVRRVENLSKAQIFEWLDELEERTRESARASIEALRRDQGEEAAHPAHLRYHVFGDLTSETDPYFPFAQALERWVRSFAAMGVGFRGAELVLDLVDRAGKYENGFMHGPEIAWRDRGQFRPARVHFTANAIPGMVGSGQRASETLFHEGGHAAHFANVDMPAPCFGQEFAPTSVAFAETQSMFFDSLLSDADWRVRYARRRDGQAMPWSVIEKGVRTQQPFAAWGIRSMLAVCYAERAIYEIPDDDLSADTIRDAIRDVERRLLFLEEGSPRPGLSIPHLLAGESSASYHGYVLALMAVEQTRRFFEERDGTLLDNPRIGPDFAEQYWRPGNSRPFGEFVEALTGRELSAQDLAMKVNRGVDQALDEARQKAENEATVPHYEGSLDLDAVIHVRHGSEAITSSLEQSWETFFSEFETWIEAKAEPNT